MHLDGDGGLHRSRHLQTFRRSAFAVKVDTKGLPVFLFPGL